MIDYFDTIPREILTIIRCYLNHHDYRELLNTRKSAFQLLKSETVYYNLKINSKLVQQLIDDFTFIYRLVKDKSRQISLTINTPTKEIVERCSSFIPGINKLIFCWSNHLNISLISNIYHVHLRWIEGINRLSGLSGVKILEVYISRSLIAIDFTPGLKRLVLYHLSELLEIAEYGSIPELQITDCPNLSLQGLGNHQKVSIDYSDDISIFRSVRYFHFEDCPTLSNLPRFENLVYLVLGCNNELFDSSCFPNLRFLRLISADIHCEFSFPASLEFADFQSCNIYDLSVLSNVKELIFTDCRGRGFHNVNVLSNACKITFHQISELEDVSSLDGVYDLKIAYCRNVKDISKLGRVHRLCVEDCGMTSLEGLGQGNSDIILSRLPQNIDSSPIRSIYKVSLQNCDGLVDGMGLSYVQHLTIFNCNNFEDTSGLGRVKSLYLSYCEKLKRLVGLENVPHIHLEVCKQLEDIDCLGKQQSLIIVNCVKLKQLIDDQRYQKLMEVIPFVKMAVWAFNLDPSRYFREMPEIFDKRFNEGWVEMHL